MTSLATFSSPSWQTPVKWLPYVAVIFGILQVWFGLSGWISPESRPIGSLPGIEPIAVPLAIGQIAAGVFIMQGRLPALRAVSATLVALAYAISLLGMFAPSAWQADYGGFPAMGGGQRIIKHLALAALALWIASTSIGAHTMARRMLALARFGTVVVLLWIGTLKFVPYEAEGIVRLVQTSPFMSWLYIFFDVRGTSTLIGVVEVAGGLMLLGWPYRRYSGTVGAAIAVGTFSATLTFLFSLPGWAPDAGAPWLSGSGAFFVKDQLLSLIVIMSLFLDRVRCIPILPRLDDNVLRSTEPLPAIKQ